jgi:hypothetical protein
MRRPVIIVNERVAAELERLGWVADRDFLLSPPEPESPCREPVWDGPYQMTCGRLLVDGECGRHGQKRQVKP